MRYELVGGELVLSKELEQHSRRACLHQAHEIRDVVNYSSLSASGIGRLCTPDVVTHSSGRTTWVAVVNVSVMPTATIATSRPNPSFSRTVARASSKSRGDQGEPALELNCDRSSTHADLAPGRARIHLK